MHLVCIPCYKSFFVCISSPIGDFPIKIADALLHGLLVHVDLVADRQLLPVFQMHVLEIHQEFVFLKLTILVAIHSLEFFAQQVVNVLAHSVLDDALRRVCTDFFVDVWVSRRL